MGEDQQDAGVAGDPDKPMIELRPAAMANPRYSVVVRRYAFGQFRIQVCDTEVRDPWAPPPHGGIVRELCAYRTETLARVLAALRCAADPPAMCRGWETPANCESPGFGRIRLDTGRAAEVPDAPA